MKDSSAKLPSAHITCIYLYSSQLRTKEGEPWEDLQWILECSRENYLNIHWVTGRIMNLEVKLR
jgi:hypothetical protein